MASPSPQIAWTSWVMVLTLGFVWGGTFMVTEVALQGITPFWLAASRIGFACGVMVLFWAWAGFRLFPDAPPWGTRAAVVFVGAFSTAVPFSLLAWGQQFVTSGFAGVSMASSALIVLPLAHFFVPGEAMTPRRVIGFLVGFAGVVHLIGADAFESTDIAFEGAGRIACVLAAACYAVSSILVRRMPPVDPVGLATVFLIIATCVTVPLAWAVEGPPPLPASNILLVLAFLGLVPTALANFLRILVIRTAGPVFMSLVNYQVPLWSVILGSLFLAEPLPGSLIVAMALILLGVGISQYGALSRLFWRP